MIKENIKKLTPCCLVGREKKKPNKKGGLWLRGTNKRGASLSSNKPEAGKPEKSPCWADRQRREKTQTIRMRNQGDVESGLGKNLNREENIESMGREDKKKKRQEKRTVNKTQRAAKRRGEKRRRSIP